MRNKINTVDEYIALFDTDIQERLQMIRQLIHEIVPSIKEKIAYDMPAFYLKHALLYVGAFKDHIGLYPGAEAIAFFKEDLKGYKTSKGTIQLAYNEKLPIHFIRTLINYQLNQEEVKTNGK